MNSIIQLSFTVFIVFIAACESQDQSVVEDSKIDLGAWQKVGDDLRDLEFLSSRRSER